MTFTCRTYWRWTAGVVSASAFGLVNAAPINSTFGGVKVGAMTAEPVLGMIEYEYPGKGTPVEEVKRCADYIRQALA